MCAKYKDSHRVNLQQNLQHDYQLHAFLTSSRLMVRVMCTSNDLGGTAQQGVPPLLLWCYNSLHNHHRSLQNNVHFGNEPFYFQQDGVPPHFCQDVGSYLDEILPGQWIGQRVSVEYPPRSPDVTPLDLYLWWFMKDIVYHRKP
jgi:hypothetical protein